MNLHTTPGWLAAAIHPVDLTVIVAYLLAITAIGILASRKEARTTSGYFLAGRSLGWPMIGLALFATNISTVHLVGLASSGFSDGLVIGNFEWMATFCLILLGLVFAPFYFRNGISTLPEYLEKRYSPGSRAFLAFMAVVAALFIHIGVSLYAGARIFEQFFQINVYWSILAISALTALYTIVGGLKAVVVTEAIQTFLLLLGAICVTVFALLALPDKGIDSHAAFQAALKPRQMSMLHPSGDLSWYAVLLGYPVLGIWYWCADQTIVQRVLGARSRADAQLGPIFAGFIKILPVFTMVLPGVLGYVLFKDKIGDAPDQTLPVLIDQLIPTGLKGLIAAGLLAALMSTVAGALNSTSTLVSIDIVKRLRPGTPDPALVRIGQVTACVVMVLAMLWSTQGENFGGIFKGINAMIACLAPPITTVFLWGVFWPRGTARAALVTLVGGFLLGAVVFVLDFPAFGFRLFTTKLGLPFMLQAWWLFCVCSALFAVTSLLTAPPTEKQTKDLCWPHPFAALRAEQFAGGHDPRRAAAVLFVAMIVLYVVFA
ncbi:MAG: sodium/solute symporter [Verrucomicrobia bacterium]|nr:sodium/solute symporter [Verrucomicrobiota bacterium]